MHHIKKWAQSVHSSRSYSKNKVPYQLTPEERYPTFRAKIDLQNFINWGKKYIWGDLPLQMEFNEPIRGVKVMNFNISHVETWNVPVTYWWKMTVCFLANFSKTAERNKTLFTGIQVRLKLSSNQQTDQKSDHSTRRYSNIKVPYQMTKMTHFGSCFSTITNNHSL